MAITVGRKQRDENERVSTWAQANIVGITTTSAGDLQSVTRTGVPGFAHYLNSIAVGLQSGDPAFGLHVKIYDGTTVIWHAITYGVPRQHIFHNSLRITPGNDLKVEVRRDDPGPAALVTSVAMDGYTLPE